MTPADPARDAPTGLDGKLAITMALGALAASCYAGYRRRTHAGSGTAPPGTADAQSLPQAPADRAATAPADPVAAPDGSAER